MILLRNSNCLRSINDFLGFFGVCRAKCEKSISVYDEEGETMNAICVAGEDIRVFSQKGKVRR